MAKERTFKKLIFDDIKAQGMARILPYIESVRYETYSGGSSLRIRTKNMPQTERQWLACLANEYQQGDFDGMTDSYTYRAEGRKPRTARFVFTDNYWSTDIQEKMSAILADQYGVTDDATAMGKMGCWHDQAMHRLLCKLESSDIEEMRKETVPA